MELVDTRDLKSLAFQREGSSPSSLTTQEPWGVVQLAERLTVTQEVVGSSPAAPGIKYAEIAQLVEHHVANVKVAGSRPAFRSI